MRLHSNDRPDDQPLAEDEADERAVDNTTVDNTTVDNTTVEDSTDGDVHPTFTPAARQAPDDEYASDEAAGDRHDDVAAQTPTLVEPAENYPSTFASDEPAVPADSYRDEADERATGYDEPVVGYTQVETVETYEPANDYTAADEPAAGYETAADAGPPAADESVVEEPVVEEPGVAEPVTASAAVPADLDQPLLSGDTDLLGQWQRVQAEFVDDPQVAVAGAADLVEQAGQALVEALQQRQRQMRTLWDHSSADGAAAPGDSVDTEQLRQMMQRYRALFNQLRQPV